MKSENIDNNSSFINSAIIEGILNKTSKPTQNRLDEILAKAKLLKG